MFSGRSMLCFWKSMDSRFSMNTVWLVRSIVSKNGMMRLPLWSIALIVRCLARSASFSYPGSNAVSSVLIRYSR